MDPISWLLLGLAGYFGYKVYSKNSTPAPTTVAPLLPPTTLLPTATYAVVLGFDPPSNGTHYSTLQLQAMVSSIFQPYGVPGNIAIGDDAAQLLLQRSSLASPLPAPAATTLSAALAQACTSLGYGADPPILKSVQFTQMPVQPNGPSVSPYQQPGQ